MYFQFIGITGWLIVGAMWKDWSLIVVNVVGSIIMFIGIIHYHFYTDWVWPYCGLYLGILAFANSPLWRGKAKIPKLQTKQNTLLFYQIEP